MTSVPSSGSAEAGPLQGPAKGLRAIVIGTGMAGLAAARIMADHFDEVNGSRCYHLGSHQLADLESHAETTLHSNMSQAATGPP